MSNTSICLSSILRPNWNFDDTVDVAHEVVVKIRFPTILFAVALFPLPAFPITTIASFFPFGSSIRKREMKYIIIIMIEEKDRLFLTNKDTTALVMFY